MGGAAAASELAQIPVGSIRPNSRQPRRRLDGEGIDELAESIRVQGLVQPVVVRPSAEGGYELIAGERRWRAARMAGLNAVPAIVLDFDEETALEVSIIENLQREDVSPLEEAAMYGKMLALGYSVRQLAAKIGKDKGYVENRLWLADAPPEIRELVSVRKDTISHAYELMKVTDEKTRRKLAKRVADGELTLAKLRRLTGTREPRAASDRPRRRARTAAGVAVAVRNTDDALMDLKGRLATVVDELADLLRQHEMINQIPPTNRDNLAKYLTITKLKLENAIAIVRATREE